MINIKKDRLYRIIVVFIFVLGVFLRLYAYFRNISFWGDEACIALNIIERSYSGLFKGLDYLQVAPPMFLVCSKFIYQLINPISDFFRDMVFRLIPMISGIAAIPVFYRLIKLWTKDKLTILVGLVLFVFNMTTILYCAQFKQYSLELLIALILYIIFYNIIFQNKNRWYYSLIIAIAPWFSLSSLFIIGSYFLFLLWKNLKLVWKLYLPFFISFVGFYFISLKSISAVNYDGMYNWWYNGYGFVNICHPLRVVIRFGELFSFDKNSALCIGLIMLIVFILSVLKVTKENYIRKLFLVSPILVTFLLSAFHLYPIEARLILFLFPLFSMAIAEYGFKYRKGFLSLVCLIAVFSSIYYTFKPYKFYTSAREVIQILESKIQPEETIVFDSAYHRFLYYLKTDNSIIYLKEGCVPYNDACNKRIEELPSGRYYLVLKEDPEDKLTGNIRVLEKNILYSTLIYFEK